MRPWRAVLAGTIAILASMCLLPNTSGAQGNPPADLSSLAVAVQQVQQADYRADLEELRRLYARLEPLTHDPALGRDARYWRGFALWRRALNAANLNMEVESIVADLEGSIAEFREALLLDSTYAEAMIGAAAGLMNVAHFRRADFSRSSELMTEAMRTLAAVRRMDPENPRLAFVAAARTYWAPPEYGGDRRRAIQEVERVLERLPAAAQQKTAVEPAWGVAELHMQLGFFYLNLSPPELEAARRHAQVALRARPEWHYVREILLPQIESAARRTERPDGAADDRG